MTEETRIVEEETAAEVVSEVASEMTAQVADQATDIVETASAKAEEVVEHVAAEVTEEVTEVADAASEAVAEASEEVAAVAEAVQETAAEAVETTVDQATAVVEAASEETGVLATISETISEAVADVVDATSDTVEAVAQAAKEAVTTATEAVSEKLATVVEATQEAVSGTVEAATEDADSAADAESTDNGEDRKVLRLSVGQEVQGVIKRITEFGAFVDIGAGRDGLVHISEMAVGRVNQVADVVQSGQTMTLWIKKLDRARNRISLTLISPDTKTIKDINDGDIVPGTVARIVPYGAFIDIGVGTDALLHVREMGNNYVAKPEDVVKLGEALDVRILAVNRRRRRIDVSLKGLRDEPEPEIAEMAEAAAALGVQEDEVVVDTFENVEVLSPMELAFKRAMEAEGVEVPAAVSTKRRGSRSKKNRSMQDEIIRRTLETMRE